MASKRERLEAFRARARSTGKFPVLNDFIRDGAFDKKCDCGHTCGAHSGLYGTDECFECSCASFKDVGMSRDIDLCVCGHSRVEHNLNNGECWRTDCPCGLYRGIGAKVDKVDEFLEKVQSEEKKRRAFVTPVRDDITSFPSLGYVVRDDEQFWIVIQRIVVKTPKQATAMLQWPRLYAWCITCRMGPFEFRNRYLNSRGVWEVSNFTQSDMGNTLYETPEQAYEVWQLWLRYGTNEVPWNG
jgi:hypothetical protein